MPTYKAPVGDVMFLLSDVFHIDRYNNLPGFADATPDLVEAVLDEAAKFCEDVLTPLNRVGDKEGCKRHADGSVTTPTGFKDAYKRADRGRLDRRFGAGRIRRPGPAARAFAGDRRIPGLGEHGVRHVSGTDARRGRGAHRPWLARAEGALSPQAHQRRVDRHDEPHRAAMRHRSRPDARPRGAAAGRQLQDHRHQDFHLRRRARSRGEYHPSGARPHRRRARRRQGNFAVHRPEIPADQRRRRRRAQRRLLRLDRRKDGHPRQLDLRDELRRRHRLAGGRAQPRPQRHVRDDE